MIDFLRLRLLPKRTCSAIDSQAPIKVTEETKERIRYLAALIDTTQADIADRAIREYAVRHADLVQQGIDHARSVLSAGDAAIAAHLLDVPVEAVDRVAGGWRRSANASPA